MTSRQITFSNRLTEIGSVDDTIRFSQSVQFSSSKTTKRIKLIDASLSTLIPNVYNYGDVNNGLIKVSQDGGANWSSIQLSNGIYAISDIKNAINDSVSMWWKDTSDPGFGLFVNSVVQKAYITIDSSKLALETQFAIDFSQSLIYELLGFIDAQTFDTDGTFEASDLAKLDWFGNIVSVQIQGFGYLSVVNNDSSYEIGSFNLDSSAGNLYIMDCSSKPWLNISPPNEISSYSIKLVGSRDNKQVILLEGEAKITFALEEVK